MSFKVQFLMDRFLKNEVKEGSIVRIKDEVIEERYTRRLWRFEESENRFRVVEMDDKGLLVLDLISESHNSSLANVRISDVELIE